MKTLSITFQEMKIKNTGRFLTQSRKMENALTQDVMEII